MDHGAGHYTIHLPYNSEQSLILWEIFVSRGGWGVWPWGTRDIEFLIRNIELIGRYSYTKGVSERARNQPRSRCSPSHRRTAGASWRPGGVGLGRRSRGIARRPSRSIVRTTSDCDVMSIKDSKHWKEVVRAASEVAKRLELPDEWLNRQCAMYAWMLPLQFVDRCEEVGTFGRLRVVRLSRLDLIATKVMGAPKRPQDLEDLRHMKPTAAELEFVSANVDRLEAENLDGATFESERAILTDLGDGIGDGNGGDA